MFRQRTFVAGALAVLVLTAAAAMVVPGVVADPRSDGPLRPGPVHVVETDVSVGTVSGQQAELTLHTILRHDGNPTEDVSVRFRAVDADSGLLVASKTVPVGTLSGEGETQVNGTLEVAREGGYRLEAVVYRNDSRVDSGTREVRGVDALKPAYATSNLSFVDDPVFEPIAVSVDDVENDRTTLSLGGWLTATGPNDANDLTVTFVVRQAESNLVAARTTVSAQSLQEGRTEMVETTVTVPSEYNYYVDAILTRDGVIVDTASGVVNLDPTKTISRNTTEEEVEFDAGDFADDGGNREEPTGTPYGERATEMDTPGFGAAVAVVALLGVALLARRRRC